MERFASVVLIAVAVLLLGVSLTGCSNLPALEATVEAMRYVDSFNFVEDKSTIGIDGSFQRVTGTYQSPNKLFRQTSSGRAWTDSSWWPSPTLTSSNRYGHPSTPSRDEYIKLRTIAIGNEGYLNNPDTNYWAKYERGMGGQPEGMYSNPREFLLKEISEAPRYRSKGVKVVNGVKVRHLMWRTQSVRTTRESFRQVDVYVGVEDSLVRRLEVGESWIPVPCEQDAIICPDILVVPGSREHVLEFSFPGDQTPILAPTVLSDFR